MFSRQPWCWHSSLSEIHAFFFCVDFCGSTRSFQVFCGDFLLPFTPFFLVALETVYSRATLAILLRHDPFGILPNALNIQKSFFTLTDWNQTGSLSCISFGNCSAGSRQLFACPCPVLSFPCTACYLAANSLCRFLELFFCIIFLLCGS